MAALSSFDSMMVLLYEVPLLELIEQLTIQCSFEEMVELMFAPGFLRVAVFLELDYPEAERQLHSCLIEIDSFKSIMRLVSARPADPPHPGTA